MPPAFFTIASNSAAISLRRLTPANRYSTLNEPVVGGKANEDTRGEDANVHPVVPPLPAPGEESTPTITEEVQGGVREIGDDEAQGKAEPDCGESEGDEEHSAPKLDES